MSFCPSRRCRSWRSSRNVKSDYSRTYSSNIQIYPIYWAPGPRYQSFLPFLVYPNRIMLRHPSPGKPPESGRGVRNNTGTWQKWRRETQSLIYILCTRTLYSFLSFEHYCTASTLSSPCYIRPPSPNLGPNNAYVNGNNNLTVERLSSLCKNLNQS